MQTPLQTLPQCRLPPEESQRTAEMESDKHSGANQKKGEKQKEKKDEHNHHPAASRLLVLSSRVVSDQITPTASAIIERG